MRIAFIVNRPSQNLFEIISNLAKLGNEVFVYVKNDFKFETEKELDIRMIKLPKQFNFFMFNLVATFHSLFANYDALNFQEPSMMSLLAKMFSRKKVICVMAIEKKLNELGFFEKYVLKRIDKVITNNSEFGKISGNILVIERGKEMLTTSKKQLLIKLGLKPKRFLIAECDSNKHSDVHYLIDAFKQLEDTSKLPNNFKLVIVGKKIEVQYLRYLQTIAEGRKNILILPSYNENLLTQLYSHAYLFVQVSQIQAERNLLRAMSFALVTLAASIKGDEMKCDGGYSFKLQNVQDLRDKLAYLINRPADISQMAKLAEKAFISQYSWRSISQKILREAYQAQLSEEIRKVAANQSIA